jgi:hypothetical protein
MVRSFASPGMAIFLLRGWGRNADVRSMRASISSSQHSAMLSV